MPKTPPAPTRNRLKNNLIFGAVFGVVATGTFIILSPREYKYGETVFLCQPQQELWLHYNFCNASGNKITGRVRWQHERRTELFQVRNGRIMSAQTYFSNGNSERTTFTWTTTPRGMNVISSVTSRNYGPDGTFRSSITAMGRSTNSRVYNAAGELVSHSIQFRTEVARARRQIHHKTNLGFPVYEDTLGSHSPFDNPYHFRVAYSRAGYEDVGGFWTPRIDSPRPAIEREISGYLRIYDYNGNLRTSVHLEDGMPHGERIYIENTLGLRHIQTFKHGVMKRQHTIRTSAVDGVFLMPLGPFGNPSVEANYADESIIYLNPRREIFLRQGAPMFVSCSGDVYWNKEQFNSCAKKQKSYNPTPCTTNL